MIGGSACSPQASAKDHAAQWNEKASSPLVLSGATGVLLALRCCVLVCNLRMLLQEAVVTYLEPAPALFAQCARKGVLSVAHPSGRSRATRSWGRRSSRVPFWGEVWFPISVWFKWVQDIEVSRAAQHVFLERSRVM